MNLFHCNLFIFGICSLQSNEVKNTDVFALAHTGIFLNIKISCQHLKCERFQASLKKKKKKKRPRVQILGPNSHMKTAV